MDGRGWRFFLSLMNWLHPSVARFPTIVIKHLIAWTLLGINNRHYDARTRLSGDNGDGVVADGNQRSWNTTHDRCLLLLMLRHACSYTLADQGADTQLIQERLSRPPQYPAHGALHRCQSGPLRAVIAIKTHVVFCKTFSYLSNIK